jgi:hypothetical protein
VVFDQVETDMATDETGGLSPVVPDPDVAWRSTEAWRRLPRDLARAARRDAISVSLQEHPERSDRRLAEELAVGRALVAGVRRHLIALGTIPANPKRVGADGKNYPCTAAHPDPTPDRAPTEKDLSVLTVQIMEVSRACSDEVYSSAGSQCRGIFQMAVIKLAARANQLRPGRVNPVSSPAR